MLLRPERVNPCRIPVVACVPAGSRVKSSRHSPEGDWGERRWGERRWGETEQLKTEH